MTAAHWPWWLGAVTLAVVTVGSCLVGRRPLGVSGIVGRFVNLRAEREAERKRLALAQADQDALEAALAAATAEAFGGLEPAFDGPAPGARSAVAEVGLPAGPEPGTVGRAPASCTTCGGPDARPTLGAHAVFLAAIVGGAFLASAASGRFRLSTALSPDFTRLVAGGGWGLAALVGGGILVGVGTTVSGGCSTGHGLSGCARLQPAGLAATATFFGVAVAVSFLLAGRLP